MIAEVKQKDKIFIIFWKDTPNKEQWLPQGRRRETLKSQWGKKAFFPPHNHLYYWIFFGHVHLLTKKKVRPSL